MVSKNELKILTSLSQKKYRDKHGLFLVEGKKAIEEFLNSDYKCQHIYIADTDNDIFPRELIKHLSINDLKKISNLKNTSGHIGVFELPDDQVMIELDTKLVLDHIQDPGNLGTIIRLCDWFGIEQLICSEDTVDCYNPKVVQASMGSLSRVKVLYVDIENYIKGKEEEIVSMLLNGENIYQTPLPKNAVYIIGNESNGIRTSIIDKTTLPLTIPQFSKHQKVESLNAATATAILLSELVKK